MKHCFSVILLGILILTSCTTVRVKQDDKDFTVTHDPPVRTRVHAEFEGRAYLIKNEDARAVRDSRAPDYSRIPAVGVIVLTFRGESTESANPSNTVYILRDNTGKELYHGFGRDIEPTHRVAQGSITWYTTDRLYVTDESAEFPLTLHTSRQGRERVDITISRK